MAFKVIQGHRGRYNQKPICNFLLEMDGRTEFLSLDRVCIPCSVVKSCYTVIFSSKSCQCWKQQ